MRFFISRHVVAAITLLVLTAVPVSVVRAVDEFDKPPISYRDSTASNCCSQLQQRLADGTQKLRFDADSGYLRSLLTALDVPVESQMLVFSKTSLQQRRIAPETPRAIYFNDCVYIGYCQSGDVLELSAVDPELGAVFYTLDQQPSETPQLERRNDNCMVCHSSSRTGGIPGHVVRSLFVDEDGHPLYSAGSRMVDHTTPIADRWGGWYVTGTHGEQTHVGNLIVTGRRVSEPVENAEGQNVKDLTSRLSVDRYLSAYSDIVALMVLEHQTMVHNRITKASFATRQAFHYEKTMNEILGYGEDNRLDSTQRRIATASDDLIEALLLVDEARLTAPIRGTSGFAEVFAKAGRPDSQGRSLRDLDLNRRMFRYPCSYLIYSEAFDALPQATRDYIWQKLWQILSGEDQSDTFAHLSKQDRRAIIEILCDTKPGLPEYWKVPQDAQISFAAPKEGT
ncbi:MAG: hypothetical protein RIK87_05715 [Fuerstiella sp.]